MGGGYRHKWWTYNDVNCTGQELCKTLGNYLSTEALMIGKDNERTVARKVRKMLTVDENFLIKCIFNRNESFVLTVPSCRFKCL